MSLPSIVSYGAAAKTSSLVWDGDLVIPDGYAIESASGEVDIGGSEVTTQLLTATNANIATPTLSGKTMKLFTIQLNPPITQTSKDVSFTVTNPYATSVTGTMEVTGKPGAGGPFKVYLNGELVMSVTPSETKTENITLIGGVNTITQDAKSEVIVTGNNLTFYVFD